MFSRSWVGTVLRANHLRLPFEVAITYRSLRAPWTADSLSWPSTEELEDWEPIGATLGTRSFPCAFGRSATGLWPTLDDRYIGLLSISLTPDRSELGLGHFIHSL